MRVTEFENSFLSALGIDAGFDINRLIREHLFDFVRLDLMGRYVSFVLPIPFISRTAIHVITLYRHCLFWRGGRSSARVACGVSASNRASSRSLAGDWLWSLTQRLWLSLPPRKQSLTHSSRRISRLIEAAHLAKLLAPPLQIRREFSRML